VGKEKKKKQVFACYLDEEQIKKIRHKTIVTLPFNNAASLGGKLVVFLCKKSVAPKPGRGLVRSYEHISDVIIIVLTDENLDDLEKIKDTSINFESDLRKVPTMIAVVTKETYDNYRAKESAKKELEKLKLGN